MDLRARSIEVILDGQSDTGAYLASPTFPIYRYSWIRDGSFIAHAMDGEGRPESAAAFHAWVAATALTYRSKVEALERAVPEHLGDADVLHPRFTARGEEVPGTWSNFQLDGWGFWLTEVARHTERTGGTVRDLVAAIRLVSRYLTILWGRACADCWEEHEDRRHPTTLCAVAAGLESAARILDDAAPASVAADIRARVLARGTSRGALTKLEGSPEMDGSALLVLGPLGPFPADDPIVARTVERVEETLTANGGVYRHLDDTFYGGGRWVLLSGALAWSRALLGDRPRAAEIVAWIESTADESGDLPEQADGRLLHPEHHRSWVERWGPVARPLLWSHAMYLIARRAIDA